MTNAVKVNHSNNTITVTKAFMKKAENFGSAEYKKMMEIKSDAILSSYRIVVRSIKKNPEKESYRNLTYKNMEIYISTLNLRTIYMAEYELARKRSVIQKSPYKYMVKWFIETFPQYKEAEIFSDTAAATMVTTETNNIPVTNVA